MNENFKISKYAKINSDLLINHPFQEFCGVEIIEQSQGYCLCKIIVNGNIDNLGHNLHGGVIYSMLDLTSMLATLPLLSDNEYAVSNNMSCSLLNSAPLGSEVFFEARIAKNGRNLIFTDCIAFFEHNNERRVVISKGQITKFRMQNSL